MRHTRGAVAAALAILLLLDLTNGVWMLPPPAGLTVQSVDMRHVLKWRPLKAACNTTVLYSVQFQGEFELQVLNSSWLDAAECHLTSKVHCDLTLDLGSDSDYRLRVRALCGSRQSSWSELSPPFNRRHTVLMPPQMTLTSVGDVLQVHFEQLPVTTVVMVTVWRRGYELQAAVYMVPAERTMLQVPALQEGEEYCVRAQTVLSNQSVHSSNTDSNCVSITGRPGPVWRIPTTTTVTVVVMVTLLVVVSCCVIGYRSHTCRSFFRKEPLPRSLQFDWDLQISMLTQEVEPCDTAQVVNRDQTDDGARNSSVELKSF
ncbi:interleukin-20 receptor subunit beta [Nelusetta ayraudi]|uniref:interleukin-20 receptor subunit beta n=1 Tax=Nelusetta ayraudi TaxID=303726 RepID=UPI003F724C1B